MKILQYHSRVIIIITIHESFYSNRNIVVLIRLNLALFIKNRYNDSSIAMTLGVVANICSFAYLSRVMDDGKTSEPSPSYRIKKKPSSGKPHQSNPLEFLALKAAALFLHYSAFSGKYAILSTFNFVPPMSLINNDTRYSHQMNSIKFTISFPLPNIRNPCKIKFHGFQIVPNVINRKISLHVFIDIESRRNFEIPYENPKITDRRRDLHRNETKLFLHHSNSRRNYGRVSPIDFEAFPVSWPAGHTLGKVRGDGAKNLAQPYLLPSNPGWKTWASFLQRPGTAEISLLKGCRWSFDFSRHGASKGKF